MLGCGVSRDRLADQRQDSGKAAREHKAIWEQ